MIYTLWMLYFLFAYVTWQICHVDVEPSRMAMKDNLIFLIASIFWPLVLILLIFWWIYLAVKES